MYPIVVWVWLAIPISPSILASLYLNAVPVSAGRRLAAQAALFRHRGRHFSALLRRRLLTTTSPLLLLPDRPRSCRGEPCLHGHMVLQTQLARPPCRRASWGVMHRIGEIVAYGGSRKTRRRIRTPHRCLSVPTTKMHRNIRPAPAGMWCNLPAKRN